MRKAGLREKAKERRGVGTAAMKAAGMNEAQWAQKHDPLFKVRGKERHRKLCAIKGKKA